MMNNLHGPDSHADNNRESNGRETNSSPLTDREVPLNPRRTPAVVQAWLDGDATMADAARGENARDVEFWSRLNEQAEERRHMRTPVHVQQRIMEAIPKGTPATDAAGWFNQESHLSNGAMLLAGAALVGVGVVAAMLLL